ncbi:hypothetical protein [Steroidobacter cummioxidans]|uniref:hypothetical protein n=1 Tax=Steroidobacter cummioxidans TaxID=1803913 RepID=UPI000E31CA73|nr:hypothetical protein [Steroidobacter cummioxidans]
MCNVSRSFRPGLSAALATTALLVGTSASANDAISAPPPPGGTVGYALTDLFWSVYQTPNGKEECPKGFNDGPREQYAKLYPNGRKVNVVESQLKLEGQTWWPAPGPDLSEFHAVQGKYSYGLNLDGKVGPNDFTHPDGTPGIDNGVYRAVGCIIGFRGPDGVEVIFQNKAITSDTFNRTIIELNGVDSWVKDDDVTVTIFRGRDRLLTDATGNKVLPGGTQRIDTRWGKKLIQQVKGKIENGVLTTEPTQQMIIPWQNLSVPSFQLIRDMRLVLKVSPTHAQGLLAGYADIDTWYRQLIRNDSTHHLSNGQISGISLYKALRRFADAHPDPKTGENTAISTALDAKFTQVFIQHPQGEAAKAELISSLKSQQPAQVATAESRQQRQ